MRHIGLSRTRFHRDERGNLARYITLVPDPGHMGLGDSVRYREGLDCSRYSRRSGLGAKADARQLLERFNRPILPDGMA